MVIRHQVALQEAATTAMAVQEYKANEKFIRLVHGSEGDGLYVEVPSTTPQVNSPGLCPPYAVDGFDVDAPMTTPKGGPNTRDIIPLA